MGVEATERGNCEIETAGYSGGYFGPDPDEPDVVIPASNGGPEPEGPALSLRVTDDRVLIKADRDEHAPEQTDGGLYLAKSLAAAVDGADEADSWFVGTIVQLGPKVNRFEIRPVVLDWLQELIDIDENEYSVVASVELRALKTRINALPAEHLDPLKVGDRVVFSWAAGQQVAIDGERYLILRESEVLAVLESE